MTSSPRLVSWSADQLRSRVQSALDSAGVPDPELRLLVESGRACPHERDALSEVDGLRWLLGEETR